MSKPEKSPQSNGQQNETTCRYLMGKVIAAAEDERKRIARELHDQTGQALAMLIAGLAALESRTHDKELADLRALATQTFNEVHDLALALRPKALDDLGLEAALRSLCRTSAQRLGMEVHCVVIGLEGNARLPGEVEVALYRICQEGLTNAVRHGRASCVKVLIQRRDRSVLAMIKDNGEGFDASRWRVCCLRGDHLGLLGMEERASLVGGTLRVESKPKAGTTLQVEVPLPAKFSP